MTNPDELERAVERLEFETDRAANVQSISATCRIADLRLILAANREMRESTFKVGDLLTYDMDGAPIRCTYRGDCEGWPLVTFDADGPDAVAIHVRPSRVKARSALTTQRGDGE